MEPRREPNKESKAAAPAAKPMAARKPGEESSTNPGQGASGQKPNQGASGQNQASGQKPNQGASGQKQGEEDLLQQAKNAGSEIMSQVQQSAGSQITRQKDSAATDLSKVVNAVRQFGQNLSADDSGPIARYAAEYGDKAAESLERFSKYIREQDPKQLLGDVQEFGRRRPGLLLGGMFLLGFAGARLIKSSMDAGSYGSTSRPNTGGRPNVHKPNVPAVKPSQTPNAS